MSQYGNTNPFLGEYDEDQVAQPQAPKPFFSERYRADIELKRQIQEAIRKNDSDAFCAQVGPLVGSDTNLDLLKEVLPSCEQERYVT